MFKFGAVVLLVFSMSVHANSLEALAKCWNKSQDMSKEESTDANDARCHAMKRELEKGGKKVDCKAKSKMVGIEIVWNYTCSYK